MDTPNANMGFELGFALGSNRHVALVCTAQELPPWLDAAPLLGYLVAKGVQLPRLQKIIEKDEHISVYGPSSSGTDLLFLAPRADEGLVGHALVDRLYPDWRSPEPTGWKLQDLPRQLDGVGEVVWLITPFAEGADRKDGQGNSLNAVIAGFAKGRGIPLRILKSTHHRRIVDIEDRANLFTNLDELQNLLREAEEKRKVALAGNISAQLPMSAAAVERIFSQESRVNSLKWYQRGLEKAQAVGRISIAGTATGTGFLVSPRHVLTLWHVIASSDDMTDCAVVFEAAGVGGGEMRRAKVVWSTGDAELDATILEIDVPVNGVSPLSLRERGGIGLSIGGRVVVVGYPFGGALSFSLSESALVAVEDHFVRYITPTSPGSSGSPVFDHNWNLLAMHHASRRVQEGTTSGEGVRVGAILLALDQHPAIRAGLNLV